MSAAVASAAVSLDELAAAEELEWATTNLRDLDLLSRNELVALNVELIGANPPAPGDWEDPTEYDEWLAASLRPRLERLVRGAS